MFFYLHCGRGFSCLYGGRTNWCLINWALFDNSGNILGQHKAPSYTSHICIWQFALRPLLNTRHRRFIWLRPGQCLWLVSSLPMLVEVWAGLPTGMGGRGSCPARASISLIMVSRKFVRFSSHHMNKKDITVEDGQVKQVRKSFFVHFQVRRLAV